MSLLSYQVYYYCCTLFNYVPQPNVTNLRCIQAHRVFCLCFAWYPCMAITKSVSVQYSKGFLPETILLTLCYYHPEPDQMS